MRQKRLALLIPHTDTTLETDLQRELGSDWTIHTTRLWLDEVGEEAEKRMVDVALPEGIRMLEGITSFDHAVFGCTSASAVYGKAGMDRIETLLRERFGCPGVSAFGAVLSEMAALGNPPIALLTPYTADVNRFMVRSLGQFGISTVYCDGLGLVRDPDIAAVEPADIRSFALGHRADFAQAGLLFLSCTNLRAVEMRAELEQTLGLPVLSSNYSIIQHILKGGQP